MPKVVTSTGKVRKFAYTRKGKQAAKKFAKKSKGKVAYSKGY